MKWEERRLIVQYMYGQREEAKEEERLRKKFRGRGSVSVPHWRQLRYRFKLAIRRKDGKIVSQAIETFHRKRIQDSDGTDIRYVNLQLDYDHVCVTTSEGELFGWGSNSSSQLGSMSSTTIDSHFKVKAGNVRQGRGVWIWIHANYRKIW